MKETLAGQYEMVKRAREVLFDYCFTLTKNDFVADNSSFGRGSTRNLLVHIANVYEFWVGKHGLQKDFEFTKYENIGSLDEVKIVFNEVDKLVQEFLSSISLKSKLVIELNGKKQEVTALQLFTHVITHEFHHKGQILSLSRHLGYIPVDTDIIR